MMLNNVPALGQGIPGVTYSASGGFYSIDAGCAGVDALPNISFAINGNVYALPPWQWTQSVCGWYCCSPHSCFLSCPLTRYPRSRQPQVATNVLTSWLWMQSACLVPYMPVIGPSETACGIAHCSWRALYDLYLG